MQVTIHLPGDSVDEDAALATEIVKIAVARAHGVIGPAVALPANASNPCQQEGCKPCGYVDVGGVPWIVYECPGGYRCYPA